ncbi:MAG: 23S rRNA (adenine(2030)-N(6))-methyltransferase RlmJ [Deltaproteobacteria bacterium]|nr:23S rRNA (adenine(2030)-N(6))-methyltransferase RlmJ [Deltaproteobacteria bacterium]
MKHAALCLTLRELVGRKDPLLFLDTHAGAGRFRLTDPTGEWVQGIGRILSRSAQRRLPELSTYLSCLGVEDGHLEEYLGSPALAQAILREDDRLELFELNPQDRARLEASLAPAQDRRVAIYGEDGYAGLARAEVREPTRLVALIDPPFEAPDEWDAIDRAVTRAAVKRPSAVMLLWYPLKAGPPHEGRADGLRQSLERSRVRAISVEARIRGGLLKPRTTQPRVRGALTGTGLILINVPSRAVARLAAVLPELTRSLSRPEDGFGWEIAWAGWG